MKKAAPLRALGAALSVSLSLAAGVALGAALIDDDPEPPRGGSAMALPNTANWGNADQATPRPAGPARGDIR